MLVEPVTTRAATRASGVMRRFSREWRRARARTVSPAATPVACGGVSRAERATVAKEQARWIKRFEAPVELRRRIRRFARDTGVQ